MNKTVQNRCSSERCLILGLGNAFHGDEGIACYLLEALAGSPVSASVKFLYLGEDPRWAGGLLYDADMVIVVGAFPLGGPAGQIHEWSYPVFQHHMPWMAHEYQTIRFLIQALLRADMAGGIPKELSFLWIEPQTTQGVGMSGQMRKAMWKAIRNIKLKLFQKGFLPENVLRVSSMVHPVSLGKTARSS